MTKLSVAVIHCPAMISLVLSHVVWRIHKRSCSNVPKDIAGSPEPERWIEVQWAHQVKEEFKTTLEIVANHIPGVLMNVTQQLYNLRISVHSLNSRELKDGTDVIYATITIQGLEHLNAVISKLSNIEGIISIKRS
ncbi:MAG: ACT domain-containing protein [Acutalibacteraceae bacterium]